MGKKTVKMGNVLPYVPHGRERPPSVRLFIVPAVFDADRQGGKHEPGAGDRSFNRVARAVAGQTATR